VSKKFFALLMLGVLSVGAAGIVSGQDPAPPAPAPVPCDGTGCDGCGGYGGGDCGDCDNDCDNDCDD
jgi:hypothetical protein